MDSFRIHIIHHTKFENTALGRLVLAETDRQEGTELIAIKL